MRGQVWKKKGILSLLRVQDREIILSFDLHGLIFPCSNQFAQNALRTRAASKHLITQERKNAHILHGQPLTQLACSLHLWLHHLSIILQLSKHGSL